MPRLSDLMPSVERGMDILLFDPSRQRPKTGRPGKVTGLSSGGRVHVTIWSDPDYDRGGPVEQVKNVRLLREREEPDLHEVYVRLTAPGGVLLKRPRGRPPKATATARGWNGQPGKPLHAME